MWILFILLLLGFMLVCAFLCTCMYSALLILCLFVHWLILMFRPYDDPFLMVSSKVEIKRRLQVLKHEAMRVECGEPCSSLSVYVCFIYYLC